MKIGFDHTTLRWFRSSHLKEGDIGTGNHRIHILKKEGYEKIPVVIDLAPIPIEHLGNGEHIFPIT